MSERSTRDNAQPDGVQIVNDDAQYRFDDDDLGAGPEWGTPSYIWEPLSDAVGGFDLDPASGAESEPIAADRIAIEDNGLTAEWYGDVWTNPPYSRDHNPIWAEKIAYEATRSEVNSITALVVASTSSKWFQDHYTKADYLTLIDHRIRFESDDSYAGASFDNVIVSFGSFGRRYISALEELGTIYRPAYNRSSLCTGSDRDE